MNISEIVDIGFTLLDLRDRYSNPPISELAIDAMLFAYLTGRFTKVNRQQLVYRYGSDKPKRIDFRFGGNNPVIIELAVRPPKGGVQLHGSQNISELRKLSRVRHSQARLRAMLLLDLCYSPLAKEVLKASYDKIHAGRGKFHRSSVRVIYVHREDSFSFVWRPYKS